MTDLRIVFSHGGDTLEMAYSQPYWIQSIDGATDAEFDVETEKLSGADGALYGGSTAKERNIVVTAKYTGTANRETRDAFYAFFQPRSVGTLFYYEEGVGRKIDYYVESCNWEPSGRYRLVSVSVKCPDPIWKSLTDETVVMAAIEGLIEWPLELAAEFEAGRYNANLMATINNPSNVDRGLTITYEASGAVTNPKMTEVTRQEVFEIDITLTAGDVLTVTTGYGKKRVQLTRSGVTSNVNNAWVYGSIWLQAKPGTNVFRYDAESGADALAVTIASTPLYWGA